MSAHAGQERIVADLLRCGTWLASTMIAVGLAIALFRSPVGSPQLIPTGTALMKSGIALFILLPVTRVALLCLLFLRERDIRHAVIAALVLAIIAASFLASLLVSSGAPPA